jgi:hypothetical protein
MRLSCKSPGISVVEIARYLGWESRQVRAICRKMRLHGERLTRDQAREVLFAIRARQGARIARLK